MSAHSEPRPLEGKVALVTGAGRGIGRALAIALAAAGAAIGALARNHEELERLVLEIKGADGRAIALPTDVTDAAAVMRSVDRTAHEFGGLDIVFANAGISPALRSLTESDPQVFQDTLNVNLFGVYATLRAAVPHLKTRGRGNVIVVGSGMGHKAAPDSAAYSSSKAAVWMLTRVVAEELRASNILVNELVPGPVDTSLSQPGVSRILRSNPDEWLKVPEDVVPLALFLASLPLKGPTGQSFSLARREL
ncbi:MAG: SDR family NAD(P)-dependent oxidoreductase [Pseudomonadota bacterium]